MLSNNFISSTITAGSLCMVIIVIDIGGAKDDAIAALVCQWLVECKMVLQHSAALGKVLVKVSLVDQMPTVDRARYAL